MQRLEDLLAPLHKGVWEVVVPKETVIIPLGDQWVRSRINIPSPGTIASYRYGQYHLHETATEYRVHLDRYDPKKHPVLHLADDAPLVLMVIDTISALATDSKKAMRRDTRMVLSEQTRAWQLMVVTGIFMLLFGVWIVSEPYFVFGSLITIIVPVLFLALSIPFLHSAISVRPMHIRSIGRLILGVGIALLGINSIFSEPEDLAPLFLLILAGWTFASAWISLKRALRGRNAVPEGFTLRLGVGILSLILAMMIFFVPEAIIGILMIILAGIAVLFGVYLFAEGMALRRRMNDPNYSLEK
ncbi:HdeD family acid-resistance protein [Methanocalculus sp.]|uniref:HdeD family acid-resistance protein n=1 Tax=Methanocalculus sp. TaxID=2004547 RepID=UPI00271CBD1A|nr:hypothetical protein [Methanocalculus sp.]MDO8841933.1 hypothetical protein [Methanocalculus sp.]